MKLAVLTENTVRSPFLASEHGLSLYIGTGGHKILFDMGQSGAFADNAQKLGIDLETVDFAVLSHGHYDHGGGMMQFLRSNSQAPVFVSPHAFEPHFNASGKNIGLDRDLPRERIFPVADGFCPAPGIRICTVPFPPADTAGMTMGEDLPEDFRHEQYLLIEEEGRRILLSGCSHKGIVGIAEYFRPDVLVGGFHFMKTEDVRILEEAAQRLMALECMYYTGHCTGQKQFAILKQIMGSRLQDLSTGDRLYL